MLDSRERHRFSLRTPGPPAPTRAYQPRHDASTTADALSPPKQRGPQTRASKPCQLDKSHSISAVRQMVVHVPVGHLRLLSDACLLRERPDLLLRETIEYLSRLPHVDDADPIVGLRSPVGDCFRRDVSGSKAHQLDDFVVLLEGRALEVHLDRDWHPVSFFVYTVQPTPLHVEIQQLGSFIMDNPSP